MRILHDHVSIALWKASLFVSFIACTFVEAGFAQTTAMNFSVWDGGGQSFVTSGTGNSIAVGYARIQSSNADGRIPPAFALYGLRTRGVLVSETGVPAAPAMQAGRIFAEVNSTVNTGVAIANPNPESAVVNFSFTDASGEDFGLGSVTIPPNGQIAQFLTQPPFNAPSNLQGTFSFTSPVPIGVTAIRGLINEHGEFLMTTLRVSDTSATTSGGSAVLPYFADGGGWTTHVVLVNSTNTTISGTVQFFGQGQTSGVASPLTLQVNGQAAVTFNYSVPRQSAVKLVTDGISNDVIAGSVWVTTDPGSSLPSVMDIVSMRVQGVTVSEAGVFAEAVDRCQTETLPLGHCVEFHLYAETTSAAMAAGTIQTGVAIANLGSSETHVDFGLSLLNGLDTGLIATGRGIAAKGQATFLLHELFPTLPLPFKGILRIYSYNPYEPMSVVGLRARYNERSNFLMTTTPPTEVFSKPTEMMFPQVVDSGGLDTQFVLQSSQRRYCHPFNCPRDIIASGTLSFTSQSGQPLPLPIQ